MTAEDLSDWAKTTAGEICDGLTGLAVESLEEAITRALIAARIAGRDDALEMWRNSIDPEADLSALYTASAPTLRQARG
jgi:hypothetical protein